MRIVYVANHEPKASDDTEGHLYKAMTELGHEVVRVSEKDNSLPDGDILLFHKWDKLLPFKGLKVCWYFDKVWQNRPAYMQRVLSYADRLFLTDGTWLLGNPHPKATILRQGIGDYHLGEKIIDDVDVAMTGSMYGERSDFCKQLSQKYGSRFKIYNSVFNRSFNDLVASVPVMVAPIYPSDDWYWSNRVYLTMGSGGFMLHPRLKGLEEEYTDGQEIVFYDGVDDLLDKIDYYLSHKEEREGIRFAGWTKTATKYSYKARISQLLDLCQNQ